MKERDDMTRREFLGLASIAAISTLLVAASPKKDKVERQSYIPFKEIEPTPEKKQRIEIILTGDIMLGRMVMITSLDEESDPTYPFEKVFPILRKADIVFGNLENPLVSSCPRVVEGFHLCAVPEMVEGLERAGVDVVNLANNHTWLYGQKGIDETVATLEKYGVSATGLGELVVKEVHGVKFGFLGFDFSSTESPTYGDYDLVTDSKPKVDVLIVGVHFSGEYFKDPTDIQRRDAKRLIGAGADVVAGHGPHWVQEVDDINGKPVFYSLGNFIFDQGWSEETRKGLAVRLIFEDGKYVDYERLPLYMFSPGQPEFVNNE